MGKQRFTAQSRPHGGKSSRTNLRHWFARAMLCSLLLLVTACKEPPTECYLPGDVGDVIRIDVDVPSQNQECYNKCYTNGYRILGGGRIACDENGENCLQVDTLKASGTDFGCSQQADVQACMFTCQLDPKKCPNPEPEWITATNYIKFTKDDELTFKVKGSIQTCEPNPSQPDIIGKNTSGVIDASQLKTYKFDSVGGSSSRRIRPQTSIWQDTSPAISPLTLKSVALQLRPYEKALIQVRGEWMSCNTGDASCTHKEGDGLYVKFKGANDNTQMHIAGTGPIETASRETWTESYEQPAGVLKSRTVVQFSVINQAETSRSLQFRYADADNQYAANTGGYNIDIFTTGCEVSDGKFLKIKIGNTEYKYEDLEQPLVLEGNQAISYKIVDPDGNYQNNRGTYQVTVGMARVAHVASEIISWVLNPLMNVLYGAECPDPNTLRKDCPCPSGWSNSEGVCLKDSVTISTLDGSGDGINEQQCTTECPCPEGSLAEDGSCNVGSVTYTGIVGGQTVSRTCTPSNGTYAPNLACDIGERTNDGIVPKIFANMSDKGQSVNFNDIAQAMLLLYIIMYGMGFMLGSVHRTQYEFVIRILKVLVVMQLISDDAWKFFSVHFFNFFIDGMVDLSDMMAGGWSSGSGRGFEFLDKTIGVFFLDVTWLKIMALIFSGPIGLLFAALIILAMLMFLVGMLKAILAFLLAVIALGLMISVSPIFISFILFQSTRPMFDRWLSQLLAFFLIPVFIFTVLIIFNEIVRMMLFGVMNYGICWDCIWEIFIPLASDLCPDCHITFCIFKGWVIPKAGLRDWEVVPVSLMLIIAFLIVCELVPKVVDLADGMARQMAGQLNTALKGTANAAWQMIGGNKLEDQVNAMPKNLVTTVARTGVGAASNVVKGTAKAGGKVGGGGALWLAGKVLGAKAEEGGLRSSLGKRLGAYGKKALVTGARDNAVGKVGQKAFTGVKAANKYRKTHSGKEIAAKVAKGVGKGIGKGLLAITGITPLARGINNLVKKQAKGGVDDKELEKRAARAAYERDKGVSVEKELKENQAKDNEKYATIDRKIRDRYADPAEKKKEAQAHLRDFIDKNKDFNNPEYKKLQAEVEKWAEKEQRGEVGDPVKYKMWDDIINGNETPKSPFQKGADAANKK